MTEKNDVPRQNPGYRIFLMIQLPLFDNLEYSTPHYPTDGFVTLWTHEDDEFYKLLCTDIGAARMALLQISCVVKYKMVDPAPWHDLTSTVLSSNLYDGTGDPRTRQRIFWYSSMDDNFEWPLD